MRAAKKRFWIVLGLSLSLAAATRADTVIKNSGEMLKGLIVAEGANDITLQTSVGELVVRTKIARKDIREFHKDAVAQNRYCRIPIHGEIGRDVKVDWLSKALDQARGFGANYVVLDIDSPGGDVAEMAKIMELLSRQEKLTIIAHVHKAMSAAAMIAITCPTIIMDGRASIGAAVPWKIGPDGTPKDVEAKFLSAYRALCKSAAQFAHHSPLLAQGMMDINMMLSMEKSDGAIQIIEEMETKSGAQPVGAEAGVPTPPDVPTVTHTLKKKGEILCLSSVEAVDCGLAAGTAQGPGDIQKILGTKDWSAVGESVWSYMESRPIAAKGNSEREQAIQSANAVKTRLAQQMADVDARIAVLTKAKTDAAKQSTTLPDAYSAELNKLDPRLSAAEHDAKITEMRSRYQALYDQANQTLARSDAELKELAVTKVKLTAAMQE